MQYWKNMWKTVVIIALLSWLSYFVWEYLGRNHFGTVNGPTKGQSDGEFLYDVFPDGFLWGSASSAYQVEGGWDADGKGESIWDRWCHTGQFMQDGSNGDVADDSYNRFREDVAALKNLGVNYYRFSLSWTRILPDGTKRVVNQPGIDYYNALIDALLAEGIQPMVTMYHWDLPQALQDLGGWWNDSMIQYFTDFADVAYSNFGDRVKLWITINEPWVVAWQGYGDGSSAPGVYDPPEGAYRAAHVMLKCHAEAYHLYDTQYRASQQGKVSITLNVEWKEPLTDSPEDIAASERSLQFQLGWYANPVHTTEGDYPQVMKDQVASKSAQQGYPQSRLPEFTPEQVARIRGTADFFGLNHYTTDYCENFVNDIGCVSYICDEDTRTSQDASWPETASGWLRVVPWGLRKILNWVDDHYDLTSKPIYITENGMSDLPGTMNDTLRSYYYTNYINQVMKAVNVDGVNVAGYTAWSLMDNLEWTSGFTQRFGLQYVDLGGTDLTRIPKQSFSTYAEIVADNGFPSPAK